jgi:hypothetical protein
VAVRNRGLAALALFAALAVAHTWPLALAPATTGRVDHADTLLNAWILAWVPHALVTQPWHLFDANIFFPARDTLAFSEHLVVPAMLGAPLTWAGASPLLVHNVVLILGMALTGWAWCVLGWRWTRDAYAAVFIGTVAAFNAHTLTRLPHVQAMHVEFLPFALLALDRLIANGPCVRRTLTLALAFTAQALCSGYLLVLSAVALTVIAIARAGEWAAGGRRWRFLGAASGAGALSLVVLLPFLVPYMRVQRVEGLTRSLDEVALYSAHPLDYLTTTARLHFDAWSHTFYRSTDALFPGVAVLVLVAWALASRVAWRDVRARAMLALAVVAFVASFGPRVPGYATAWEWIPLLQGIRGAARFGYLVTLGLGVVAGIGLAQARALVPRRAALALGLGAVVLANADAWRAPLAFERFDGIPAIYDLLASEPGAVVVELPFPEPERVDRNARAVLASTRHWARLLNGYSGFTPASYVEHARALRGFPDERAWALLRARGVTHLVVQTPAYDAAAIDTLLSDRRVRLVARTPRQLLLRLPD